MFNIKTSLEPKELANYFASHLENVKPRNFRVDKKGVYLKKTNMNIYGTKGRIDHFKAIRISKDKYVLKYRIDSDRITPFKGFLCILGLLFYVIPGIILFAIFYEREEDVMEFITVFNANVSNMLENLEEIENDS